MPPAGSVSVFIKYGPADQSIPAKVPLTAVPLPISKLAKPFELVIGVCVSTNTAVPVAEPCNTEICMPTVVLLISELEASLITVW